MSMLPSENLRTYYQRIGMLAEAALAEPMFGITLLPELVKGLSKSASLMLHDELRGHLPKRPLEIRLSELSSFSTTGIIEVAHWRKIANNCGFADNHPCGIEKTAVELETFLDMRLMALDTTGLLLEHGFKVKDLPQDELAEARSLCRAVMREFRPI